MSAAARSGEVSKVKQANERAGKQMAHNTPRINFIHYLPLGQLREIPPGRSEGEVEFIPI